jgi:hypothetical protein
MIEIKCDVCNCKLHGKGNCDTVQVTVKQTRLDLGYQERTYDLCTTCFIKVGYILNKGDRNS